MKLDNILFFDVETTTHNKGHPFDPRNFLVSYAYTSGPDIFFKYHTDADFISGIQIAMESATHIVGHNIKFDLHWLRRHGITPNANCRIWDTQLAEFIYTGQEHSYASLNDTCATYDLPTKTDLVKEFWDSGVSTEDIPLPILREYNCWDVQLTKMLFNVQHRMLSDKQKRLVWLEGEDLKTLQEAEWHGVKFDTPKSDEVLVQNTTAIDDIERRLSVYLPDGIPEGTYNFDSGDHLSALLYGGEITFDWTTDTPATYQSGEKVGQAYTKRKWHKTTVLFKQRFRPLENSEVRKTKENPDAKVRFYQTAAPTLQQLRTRSKEDRLLLQLLAERSAKIKVKEMIISIKNKMQEKNWENDLIHGQFNQNVVITGRLSSSAPNMQNTPLEVDALLVSRYASQL